MNNPQERDLELHTIALLCKQGYTHITAADLESERDRTSDVVLKPRLKAALQRINPETPITVIDQAIRQVLALSGSNLIESNYLFYQMLLEGVAEEYQKNAETVGVRVRLIDFDDLGNNDFAVCNQFTVTENNNTKRPDVILFINGLPLAVIELKSPVDVKATVDMAFNQLQTYKKTIPGLFCYNGVLVASDGLDARVGSLTAGRNRFMTWKTIDGMTLEFHTNPQINTVIKGMLRPDVLLKLVRHFTVFEQTEKKDAKTGMTTAVKEKKIAAYHQYHAVNRAVESTIRASSEAVPKVFGVKDDPRKRGLPDVSEQSVGDRKAGVVWHTQGSGKSLSMVFYAGLLITHQQMRNPTIVVITDRNDLDDQLYGAFVAGKNLLRQTPQQADNRTHLKALLKTASGGVVFSTLQKFSPKDGDDNFEMLSARKNIVVIADEAHRSQYGFGAKTFFMKDGVRTSYGFAKYLRDALPEASFIGFTGTPIEKEDASTPAVFGNYIDIYDIEQAVEDKATVPIYYESRLVQVHLKEEGREELDAEIEEITESAETSARDKAKAKWTRQEAIIGHHERMKTVADDVLTHFEQRRDVCEGKAMLVVTSRRIAVAMYEVITKLRPDWHDDNRDKGAVKVVMTSTSSDPVAWQQHATTKQQKREVGDRFKDPADPLRLVIVCDMWLTGFDAPCLDTIYVDKIMRGHNLMQAIARVNRVYKDKIGGLVVDYIGIASDLKRALAAYTKNGGKGEAAYEQERAVDKMLEKHDVVTAMFHPFDYRQYFTADTGRKLELILEAEEHILTLTNGKERFTKETTLLSQAFALSVPDRKAMAIKADVGFFQAVQARLSKFESAGGGKSNIEMETAIRQIVDKAIVVEGVIDIFDAAGIKKPDISILDDEFLAEIRGMKHKNLALELLLKLLRDEIISRGRTNLAQSRKFSELLEAAIRKYKNNLLTAVQVIDELIRFAREIKESDTRAGEMGLSQDEVAFYDALVLNESAREVMEHEELQGLAQMLVENVKKHASIDWTIRESVRARLRVEVRRLLKKYGYPPDQREMATDRILEQAELMADEWGGEGVSK